MSDAPMRIDRDGTLASLVLTQPDRGNPVDGAFCRDWAANGTALAADAGVRAIVLTAEGRNFSMGGDIGMFSRNLDNLPAMIREWAADFHIGVARLQEANAPLVAAVQGICAGGAVSIIAGADYVVAEDSAKFVSAYVGLGYCCDGGATVMLSRRMGPARAKRFLMLRETLDAAQALAAGLIDEVVPAGTLADRARAVAQGLANGPTQAYGELKRLFLTAGSNPLEAQLDLEAAALARCSGTADSREAITAFIEKRKPVFGGN